jgi:hypothetical protein
VSASSVEARAGSGSRPREGTTHGTQLEEGRDDGGEAGGEVGAGVFRLRLVVFEEAMRAVAAGVDDALRDPLMVEVHDLFA